VYFSFEEKADTNTTILAFFTLESANITVTLLFSAGDLQYEV